MKKLLAIFLAVMMVFSLGVTGFAADGDEVPEISLPDFPTQETGKMYLASENIYIEAGQTYNIPVYWIADYTPEAQSGSIVAGFNVVLASDVTDQLEITAITPSAEVQALKGYELIGCEANLFDDPALNMFSFKTTDFGFFNQAKLELAIVTVQVADTYVGRLPVSEGSDTTYPVDTLLDIRPAEHFYFGDFYYPAYDIDAPISIGVFDDEAESFYPEENIYYGDVDGPFFIIGGHLIEKPPVKPWQDTLKEWALNVLSTILDRLADFFATLNSVLPDIV